MLVNLGISLIITVLCFIILLLLSKDDFDFRTFLDLIFISIGLGIIVFLVGTYIYIFTTYGNKPMDEIPAWVRWFMQNGNKD